MQKWRRQETEAMSKQSGVGVGERIVFSNSNWKISGLGEPREKT
jgi:hypothetical protein